MNANLKIISDLKNFITQTSADIKLRQLFVSSESDFIRNRKLGFNRLIYLMLNFMKKSYSIEITDFYSQIDALDKKVTKSAFCQQRMKIKALFFAGLNELLVRSFYEHYGKDVRRWNGFRLIAVDGSTAYLVNNIEVVKQFGTHSNQSKNVPMGQVVSAFDVLNGITIWADLYPIKTSEQKVAQHWLSYYDPDMLLIYDRGYPGFISIFLHQTKEISQPFVMRCPVNFTYEIRAFVASDQKDIFTRFRSNQYSTDELYKMGYIVPVGSIVDIRLVKVILDDGTIEVLVTNLFDQQQYPDEIFKELYFKRWGIETKYDTLKNQLQLEAFSGQKPITIMQDFYITVFLSNLQEIIAKPCEMQIDSIAEKRKHNYKINRNVAFGVMKNRIVDLFISYNPECILNQLQQLFLLHIEPERPGRKYPRLRKCCRTSGKYQALSNYKRAV
jgi:IS4 transposase